jgi:hypothetical protein
VGIAGKRKGRLKLANGGKFEFYTLTIFAAILSEISSSSD